MTQWCEEFLRWAADELAWWRAMREQRGVKRAHDAVEAERVVAMILCGAVAPGDGQEHCLLPREYNAAAVGPLAEWAPGEGPTAAELAAQFTGKGLMR